MAKKGFDLEKVVDDFLSRPTETPEQTEDQEAEAPARVTRQKGKDVVVSFRLDEAVVERFNDYAFYKRVSKKEALQTIITEYLSGRVIDEGDRLILERFSNIFNEAEQEG